MSTKGSSIESMVHMETVIIPRLEGRIEVLEARIASLRRAVEFYDKCAADRNTSSPTGAMRDAIAWIIQAAHHCASEAT